MTHRSRLTALGIDVPAEAQGAAARFWATALGHDPTPDESGTYVGVGRHAGLHVFVQRIGDGGPRLHLDIETDDVDAEVARLVAAGATRVARVQTWEVLRDPAGLVFCVVPPQTDDFPAGATTWD